MGCVEDAAAVAHADEALLARAGPVDELLQEAAGVVEFVECLAGLALMAQPFDVASKLTCGPGQRPCDRVAASSVPGPGSDRVLDGGVVGSGLEVDDQGPLAAATAAESTPVAGLARDDIGGVLGMAGGLAERVGEVSALLGADVAVLVGLAAAEAGGAVHAVLRVVQACRACTRSVMRGSESRVEQR
ncbi:hypothetical protein Are01nite_10740 [Actinoplanes regularis]|nr:hypothetical protein Are01nite_10740 [Actinoplanes regularis]